MNTLSVIVFLTLCMCVCEFACVGLGANLYESIASIGEEKVKETYIERERESHNVLYSTVLYMCVYIYTCMHVYV